MTQPTLHDFLNIGNHFYHEARKNGDDSSKALDFVGAVTVAIGAQMLLTAWQQSRKSGISR